MQFEIDHPNAFQGDSIDFLRCIYRDPDLDLAVRIDAAGKAARYERPTLAAIAVQQSTHPTTQSDIDAAIMELVERGSASVAPTIAGTAEDSVGGLVDGGQANPLGIAPTS